MDKQKSRVLQDFIPFGAAALVPLILIYNDAKQGNGYRLPLIALGRPVGSYIFIITISLHSSHILDKFDLF